MERIKKSHFVRLQNLLNEIEVGISAEELKEIKDITQLMQKEIESGWHYQANISEALNSGDGVYRP